MYLCEKRRENDDTRVRARGPRQACACACTGGVLLRRGHLCACDAVCARRAGMEHALYLCVGQKGERRLGQEADASAGGGDHGVLPCPCLCNVLV